MSVLVIPNVLVNGNTPANIVDAVGLNANFTAIATAVNNIYPSQVLPLTALQATFGAVTGGYTFPGPLNFANAGGAGTITANPSILGSSGGSLVLGSATGQPTLFYAGATNVATLTSAGEFALPLATASQVGLLLGVGSADSKVAIEIFSASGFSQIGTNAAVNVPSSGTAGSALFLGTDSINAFAVDRAGNLGIGGSVANKVSGTAWANPSDARIKENVVDYAKGLEAVLALRPVSFTFAGTRDDGKTHVGYIAQEVGTVHPEMVTIKATEEFEDFHLLDTSDIVPMLVNAVKVLAQRLPAPQ